MRRLTKTDRNACSMNRRQKRIDELVKEIGNNEFLHFPEENTFLVSYQDKWGEGNRLGVISYSGEKGMEYIFNNYGIEGARNATITFNEKPIIKKEGNYRKDISLAELENLPNIVQELIPEITGYTSEIGGMFPYNSDGDPRFD